MNPLSLPIYSRCHPPPWVYTTTQITLQVFHVAVCVGPGRHHRFAPALSPQKIKKLLKETTKTNYTTTEREPNGNIPFLALRIITQRCYTYHFKA